MVLDYKVVASTDGDYPFNKDQIHKLIEDATPANLVESILHKLKATSSKHKFIVTATKITSQESTGSVSCQTGTLWNEKKDGYVSLQVKERQEEESGTQEKDKETEINAAIEHNDRDKDSVVNNEIVKEQPDDGVVDVLDEYQQHSPITDAVPETSEVKEPVNLYTDATKEHVGGVSSELVPDDPIEPIEAEGDKTIHPEDPSADIDEAVGSIPTTEASLSEPSAHDEPVMLAAVDPEEADRIMKERDLNLEESKVSVEVPIAQSTPGSEATEKKEFESLGVDIDEHEESSVQPVDAEKEPEDLRPEVDEEKAEPQEVQTEPENEQPAHTEDLQSSAVVEAEPVKPKVATTYMVSIYWVYVH
ncbi:hypothetical protein JA9_001611 [Meyerozyma sp. JA9]|nr:hypothetical protein JA9_001611 [Meyerozyma sp. JA9]